MDNRRSIRYLFAHRATRFNLDGIVSEQGMNMDNFDVLLAIDLVNEYTGNEVVKIAILSKFMRNYFKYIYGGKLTRILDELHEENYVWINNLQTVTITKLGLQFINNIYEKIYWFERQSIRPIFKALTSGIINKEGELIAPSNVKKKKDHNPYNPYIGVHRLKSHLFGAYVRPDNQEIFIGAFKKPIDAAKARDKYIREKNLKITKSIKV